MKSPLAFGSACNCDDVPDICFMQRKGTTEHTEYTEVANQGSKKSGRQGSTERGKCTEAGHQALYRSGACELYLDPKSLVFAPRSQPRSQGEGVGEMFCDVDNDSSISPLDALSVINWLNSKSGGKPRALGIEATGRSRSKVSLRARSIGCPNRVRRVVANLGQDLRSDFAAGNL
jgi:hypothetical protein